MKFAIGNKSYFENKGYDTKDWRKNHDESLVIVHLEFAKVLCDESELIILSYPSEKFDEFISSKVWVGEIEEVENENSNI